MNRSRSALAALLLVAACGDDAPGVEAGADAGVPPPTPSTCERIADVVPLRQVTHPGRGVELDLRLVDADGLALSSDAAACLQVDAAAAVAPRAVAPGATLLLVAPPAAVSDRDAWLGALAAVVAARPPAERIALHRWGRAVTQIADFTTDRERLLGLAAEGLGTADADPLPPEAALAQARSAVEAVSGTGELALRAVVVVSSAARGPEPAAGAPAIAWLDPSRDGAAAGRAAAEVLDAVAAAGAVAIGTCGASGVTVGAPAMEPRGFALLPWLEEEAGRACDATAVAAGARTLAPRVELLFTPEERAVFDERRATKSRRDFELSIQLHPDDAPIRARAHLRGHGTMLCDRKAYSVDLDGTQVRHVLPGVTTDEFLLLSLCWDQAYVENVTAYQLLAPFDLFPYRYRYVELRVDGESQGVYLLIEKPADRLVRDHARPLAVLRRNHDGEGERPDVRWTAGATEPALAAYDALLSLGATGDALVAELERRMDLSQYLRWLAVMSALHNGDIGDETWFLATERVGEPGLYWSITAWDPEDLLRVECVWEQYAFQDPWGLVYCAESWLDHAILGDPAVYERFVTELEGVLAGLDDAAMAGAQEATLGQLLPLLADPAVRAASIELGSPATYELAEAAARTRLRIMTRRFLERRAELLALVAAYRAAH